MAKKQVVTEQSLRKIEVREFSKDLVSRLALRLIFGFSYAFHFFSVASTIKIRSSEFKDQDPEVVKEMIKRALNSGGDENE